MAGVQSHGKPWFVSVFRLILAGTMKTIIMRPRDKKIAKNTAKTALLATAALAIAYDSRCRSYLHFPRAGVEHLARLFFLPAMRLRASSGHALHNDGNDECVTTVLLRMRSKDPWVLLAEHLGGGTSPPASVFSLRWWKRCATSGSTG